MAATATPQLCTYCPNPAIGTLPIYLPSDVDEVVCGECLTAYWAAREASEDDYS